MHYDDIIIKAILLSRNFKKIEAYVEKTNGIQTYDLN